MSASFSLSASAYRELAKAIKPHADRSGLRPMIAGVNIRCDGSRVCFEATDSYTLVRGVITLDESMVGDREPFEAVVSAAHFFSLRPTKLDAITVVRQGKNIEVTCGVVTLRLEDIRLSYSGAAGTFPDYDAMIRKNKVFLLAQNDPLIRAGVTLNQALLSRLAGLPGRGLTLRFDGPLSPVFFVSEGIARYEGVVMPMRAARDGGGVKHEDWTPAKPKAASRRRAA